MMDSSATSENVRSTSFENVRSSSSENVRLMSTTDGKKQVDDTTKQINDEEKPKPPPTLKECSPTWFWRVGVHLLLLVVPIAYLVLLGIVGYLNGQAQSSFGDDILEVLQLASTLWPISFAAVLGPFLKTLALYQAERGATVGSLEFLLTGQITVAAFKNLFTLQYIRFWTIGIAAVWCLSPLGGQAIVRSLRLEKNTQTTEIPAKHYFRQVPLRYYTYGGFTSSTHNFTGDRKPFGVGTGSQSAIPDFRRVVMSSLSRPDILVSHANQSNLGFDEAVLGIGGYPQAARLGRQDMWQNVRIPFMEYLDGYDSSNPTVWTPVPQDKVTPFSSFIGVPIRGGSYSRAGNSSMVLNSRYHSLQCGKHLNGTDWMRVEKYPRTYFHHDILNATENVGAPQHIEYFTYGRDTGMKPSLWIDYLKTRENSAQFYGPETSDPSQLKLMVGGQCLENRNQYTGMRFCKVGTSYVDVAVECTRLDNISDLNCQATKIRRSKIREFSSNHSDLSDYQIAGGISFEMPSITATYTALIPSLLERYISNPPTAFKLDEDPIKNWYGACYKNVSQWDFEARISTALNTFIMASYNYTVLTGSDGTSLSQRDDMWQDFEATWTEYTEPVYTLNIAWLCISVTSTVILLVCTVSNAFIRHMIIAPNFLDSVDGLIRDSPYINIDNESSCVSSGVSSQDRIKFTKDIQVQIQDVRPYEHMGKIALTSDIRSERLDWKRVYTN